MELDFTKLRNIAAKNDFTDEPKEEYQEDRSSIKLTMEQTDHNNMVEMYTTYQNNIKSSVGIKTDILKGVEAGEPAQLLLLKAVECISLMTGDKAFLEQVLDKTVAIYGEGLLEPAPLEIELKEVQVRLVKLEEAYTKDEIEADVKKRIEKAIEAHKNKIEYIEKILSKK